MSCSGIDIFNPYSWIIFAGLLMGVAVTGLLKGKRRNWALFSFFLSGSLLLALLGLFLPGPGKFLDMQLLYFFIGSTAIGIAATWFWKSAGLAFFLLISLSIIFIPLSLKTWHCFSESIEVGRFRLLSQSEAVKTVEIQMNGEDGASFHDIGEEAIEIEVELLRTEDYYFFLKARNLFRLKSGFLSVDDSFSGLPVSFSRLIQTYHDRIPGAEFLSVTTAPFTPDPFTTYVIILEFQDGNPSITIEQLYL